MGSSCRKEQGFTPDRTIHEPVRLQIISYLAVEGKQVPFIELRDRLDLTSGNLSVHLRRLQEAGYVSIDKSFEERRPKTCVSLTRQGLEALQHYLEEMEEMIEQLKKSTTFPEGREQETG